MTSVEVDSPADVIELYRSTSPARIAPVGFSSQPCEAYLCAVNKKGISFIYVALFLTESNKVLVYASDKPSADSAVSSKAIQEAFDFAESIGFVLEKVALGTDPAQQEKFVRGLPVLRLTIPPPTAPVPAAQPHFEPSPDSSSWQGNGFTPAPLPSWLDDGFPQASPSQPSEPAQLFQLNGALAGIEVAAAEDVNEVYRSTAVVQLVLAGLHAQPVEAYICLVSGGGVAIFVALFLTESRKALVYTPEQQPTNYAECGKMFQQAVKFVESFGFSMETVNLGANVALRQVVLRSIPVLRLPGSRPLQPLTKVPAADLPPPSSVPTVTSPAAGQGSFAGKPAATEVVEPFPLEQFVVRQDPFFAEPQLSGAAEISPFQDQRGGESNDFFTVAPAGAPVQFSLDKSRSFIEAATPAEIVELYSSLGSKHIAPEGANAEPCDAYIFAIKEGAATNVYVALYLNLSGKGLVYPPEKQPQDQAGYGRTIGDAVVFLESLGFMMDRAELGGVTESRKAALSRVKVLRLAGASVILDAGPEPTTAKEVPPAAFIGFSSAEPEGARVQFGLDKTRSFIEVATATEIKEAYRSLTPATIAPDGVNSEPCDACICAVTSGGQTLVYLALFLTESDGAMVYTPARQPQDQAGYAQTILGAIEFLESIGFMLERVDLGANSAQRLAALADLRALHLADAVKPPPVRQVLPEVAPHQAKEPEPAPIAAPPIAAPPPPVRNENRQSSAEAPSIPEQLGRIMASF